MRRRILILGLPVVIALVAILALTGAGKLLADTIATTAGQVPQEISYTGRIVDGSGTPITGTRTVTFSVYDASSGGGLHWTETKSVTLDNVGYFATRLGSSEPIAPSVFDGSTRYLQISLNGTTFPRQKFSSVPYAFQSYYASHALTATYAYTAGYAIDAKYAMTATYAMNANGGNGSSYQYVVVVAKSGGDYTSISEAMNSISPSSSERYLIKVMPGTYNERVVVKPYVHLKGAGIHSTLVISSVVGDYDSEAAAVMVVPDNAQVSHLTVNNTGTSDDSAGIHVSGGNTETVISHVGAIVAGAGGDRHVSFYINGGDPSLYNVHASAAGGGVGSWTLVNSAADTFVEGSYLSAEGDSGVNAVRALGGEVVVQNTQLHADGTAPGSVFGVDAQGSSTVRLDRSSVHSSGASVIPSNASATVYAGATLLEGPVAAGTGTLKCAQSYNGDYNELGTNCTPLP